MASRLYLAPLVGRYAAFLARRSIGCDCIDTITVRPEPGRFHGKHDFADGRGIIADQFKGGLPWRRLGRQTNRLAVERPITLCMFRDGPVIELVTEMTVFLQFESGPD